MKWLIRIVGAAIALAVVIGVYLASLDVNQYKGEIIDLVEAATGREFSTHGDFHLKISLLPTVAADGIVFGSARSAAPKNMVTIERIESKRS